MAILTFDKTVVANSVWKSALTNYIHKEINRCRCVNLVGSFSHDIQIYHKMSRIKVKSQYISYDVTFSYLLAR